MPRRIHVDLVQPGRVVLPAAGAHHARDVLRLAEGAEVEVFDGGGRVGAGRLVEVSAGRVVVEVDVVSERAVAVKLTIASAVPKGQRADWMVEKLAELGVMRFVPLATARSVVHPEGRGKLDRWRRLATEAARQSGSRVMQIDELTPLAQAIAQWQAQGVPGWFCATEVDAQPLASMARVPAAWCFIGPEGGWTDAEIQQVKAAGLVPVRLTQSVLRIETAAIVAAGLVSCDQSAVGR